MRNKNIMFIVFPGHSTTGKTFNDNIVNTIKSYLL